MSKIKKYYTISYVLIIYFFNIFTTHSFATSLDKKWQEKYTYYVREHLNNLRDLSLKFDRPRIYLTQAVGILDFIEKGQIEYGNETLAISPPLYELIIDICNIVDLQHSDFKNRYNIYIEQRESGIQHAFSLFGFDKIANGLNNCMEM